MISAMSVKPTQLCHCQDWLEKRRMQREKAPTASQSIKMSHKHNTNVVSQGNMQMAACSRNPNPIKNAEDVNLTIFHSS